MCVYDAHIVSIDGPDTVRTEENGILRKHIPRQSVYKKIRRPDRGI